MSNEVENPTEDQVVQNKADENTATETGSDDIASLEASDDPVLRQLAADLKAEKQAGKEPDDAASQKTAEAAQQTQANTEQQSTDQPPAATDKKPVMIPKGRFDEVGRERDEARASAAYYKGVADTQAQLIEAIKQGKPAEAGDTQNQTQQKTIEQQLEDIDAKRIEIAEQYENGDISATEWEKQKVALGKQERALNAQMAEERVKSVAVTPQGSTDDALYMDEKLVELEKAHPYTLEITDQADWEWLNRKAAAQLYAEGIQLKPNDQRSNLILRTRIAELTDVYGPSLTGKTINIPGKQGKTAEQPKAPTAQQRQDKLAIAHQHPPAITRMGGSGAGPGEVSEADIEKMSDEEILALPESTRNRLMGIT